MEVNEMDDKIEEYLNQQIEERRELARSRSIKKKGSMANTDYLA